MTPEERNSVLEEAAKLVEYRGQCAVAMINAEERIEEKKAYAWDALQHGIAIRELKPSPARGEQINADAQVRASEVALEQQTSAKNGVTPLPASLAPSTAPQVSESTTACTATASAAVPAAAVPDDPVAVWAALCEKDKTWGVIRALAAHYEARGMRKAQRWIPGSELPSEKLDKQHPGDTVSKWLVVQSDGYVPEIARFHWPTNSWETPDKMWPTLPIIYWMPLPTLAAADLERKP